LYNIGVKKKSYRPMFTVMAISSAMEHLAAARIAITLDRPLAQEKLLFARKEIEAAERMLYGWLSVGESVKWFDQSIKKWRKGFVAEVRPPLSFYEDDSAPPFTREEVSYLIELDLRRGKDIEDSLIPANDKYLRWPRKVVKA
jgi:hypothetical protein